ncbi:MAG TPA: Nramp family divalent metal transporter [Flavobacteriales bacterium]|nr:Nramp family divalent metal transporter [Flavobacteriales bacterium]
MISQEQHKSLEEVNQSVEARHKVSVWKRLIAFSGPAYLVSVGYMDPGNWATDIEGGSRFGYALLWVLLMSNIMALLLQSLCARLGLVRGLDLAQASRETYPRYVNFFLWILAEIAIAACDLAEVLGMAIGLQLLTGLPLLAGVSITVLDTFLLLLLQRWGMRKMEIFIIILIATIGFSFLAELIFAKPNGTELIKGLVPSIPDGALYIIIGIIGATVMPHNLYLHSSLVQTRKIDKTPKGIRQAIKYNFIDTGIALNLALFVNAAILILAAAAFNSQGHTQVKEIQDAHTLLGNLGYLAPVLFAVALIASGQSSTLTGTLSGQIIMEGYLNLRIQPWLRRLITRLIAIIPAFLVIYIAGEEQTGALIVLSQVILSLQLGFAIIPLIHITSDKATMGEFVPKLWMRISAWIIAGVIVFLNAKLVVEKLSEWIATSPNATLIYLTVVPLTALTGVLLVYITIAPVFKKVLNKKAIAPDGIVKNLDIAPGKMYSHIAVTVDFSESDSAAISNAIAQGGTNASYLLIHIVETAGARMYKQEVDDMETSSDKVNLEKYASEIRAKGYTVNIALGYGHPQTSIPEIVNASGADLLVMASHGHTGLKKIILGSTLGAVRQGVKIPVLIV